MYYYNRSDKIAFINDKWVFGVSAYISNDVKHTQTNVCSFLLLNLLHEPTHVASLVYSALYAFFQAFFSCN